MKVKIIVHCLVKNEGRFVWYAINSVLPYVDKVMVWDTGSTDDTLEILKTIKSEKISFKEVGEVDPYTFTKIRQKMLIQTPKDFTWLMLLDGDEVWPESSIEKVTEFAKTNLEYESIVVRTNNLVGDIYHRLPESAGRYHLAGQVGHLNLRLMNLQTIPGLNVQKPHGQQGYIDKDNNLVQNRNQNKIKFLDVYYHHATHLARASASKADLLVPKRKQKLKHELGEKIPPSQIPSIFFQKKPSIVPDVSAKAGPGFWLLAAIMTIPRRIKRLFISSQGY